jgi:hypothetical protein
VEQRQRRAWVRARVTTQSGRASVNVAWLAGLTGSRLGWGEQEQSGYSQLGRVSRVRAGVNPSPG